MVAAEKKISTFPICLLVGFDRSGSSMISRLLAYHPQINLLFHPFNNTEITRTQWEYWQPGEQHEQTYSFLKKLSEGNLDLDYVKSDWLSNYSKSLELKPNELILVKDTKFHFKIEWLKKQFPEIEVFGIWRDPRDILYSLVRNDFHHLWYTNLDVGLLKGVCLAIHSLNKYADFLKTEPDKIELMALGIAVRTELLRLHIGKTNWLVYEEVLQDPDFHLNTFLSRFGLDSFQFKDLSSLDFNVVGKKFEQTGGWKTFFSPAQQARINSIFQYLL